ncbi:unnamed protein product, partial [Rotaria sp. Silwood1]
AQPSPLGPLPTTLVLLSGDIDFVRYIHELRFSHNHYVIVVYNPQANSKLLQAAQEAIPWSEFTDKPRVNIPNKRGLPNLNPNQMASVSEKVDTDKPRVNSPKKKDPPKPNPNQIVSIAQTVDDAASRIPLPGALPSVVSKNRVVPTNTEDSTRINSVTTKMPHTKVKCNKERPCDENPKM